jgi:ADP-heptose:LPS heptosyltransferase
MHLAAASGAPTIGLFGPTMDLAEKIAPAGKRAAWVLAEHPSMEALSVADVYAACVRLLRANTL